MIKRRFYKQELVDREGASSDSDSSSSDSDSPSHQENNDFEEGEHDDVKETPLYPSSGSGYESEDSSGNEVRCDSSGLPVNEEDCSEEGGVESNGDRLIGEVHSEIATKASSPKDPLLDLDSCILKHKSVFKCKLCPRIVCLSESTLRAHLSSKRHARSKKLQGEGRLRLWLNSDGETEEDQETHAERHARTVALAQEKNSPKKRDKGRKRQRKKRKKKCDASDNGRSEEMAKKNRKKRRKTGD